MFLGAHMGLGVVSSPTRVERSNAEGVQCEFSKGYFLSSRAK